jgi:hypothetical protein
MLDTMLVIMLIMYEVVRHIVGQRVLFTVRSDYAVFLTTT